MSFPYVTIKQSVCTQHFIKGDLESYVFQLCKTAIFRLCKDETCPVSCIIKLGAMAICCPFCTLICEPDVGCFTQPKHVAF